MDPLAITGIAAVLCFWLAVLMFWLFVRWVVRKEVRRAITKLRESKFALVVRDKRGRFTR